jgi:hypothetical protein
MPSKYGLGFDAYEVRPATHDELANCDLAGFSQSPLHDGIALICLIAIWYEVIGLLPIAGDNDGGAASLLVAFMAALTGIYFVRPVVVPEVRTPVEAAQ